MARSDSTDPRRRWRRFAVIAAVIVVPLAVAAYVVWPRLQVHLWLSNLHSDDQDVHGRAVEGLASFQGRDWSGLPLVGDALDYTADDLNRRLHAVLADGDVAFTVRREVGRILLRRNRLALVEAALRSESLEARIGALAVLSRETYFRNYYVHGAAVENDPNASEEAKARDRAEKEAAWGVEETLRAWLRREGDGTRHAAVAVVTAQRYESLVPEVRPLVRGTSPAGVSRVEQMTIREALNACVVFGDCETVTRMIGPARSDPDDRVRWEMIKHLFQAVIGPQPPCPEAAEVETVKEVVLKGLDGGPYTLVGVLSLLGRNPDWAAGVERRLHELARSGETGTIRRMALAALGARGPEAVRADLPTYFHDPDRDVRSEAVSVAESLVTDEDAAFVSCLIGALRDETEHQLVFTKAMDALRRIAGGWVGLPPELEAAVRSDPAAWNRFREDLFRRGESRGVDRLAWATDWFAWWVEREGLAGAEAEEAAATWRALRDAVDAGSPADVRRLLEAWGETRPPLFLYEQGWLATR